ncbi:MAG TPA: carbamoyltransferase C-terminal domain-containing protein [Streptosporangiaceae bacterium]
MTTSAFPPVVLGYSGLDGSCELKAGCFPGLDERERRLCQGLDSAAALLVDGELVAAVQQERYSGRKFDHAFPREAIDFCLAHAGLAITDVDVITHNFDYTRLAPMSAGEPYARRRFEAVYAPQRQTDHLWRHYPELARRLAVTAVRHHRAHALSAAIPSGFTDALVVVIDGMGELEAITVWAWQDWKLRRLAALDFRSSLGLFYALITMHLGFLPNSDEYKVMALAAAGDPDRFGPALDEAVLLGSDGKITVPVLARNTDARSRETFSGARDWLQASGCAGRQPGDPVEAGHADLAAAAQRRLEQAVFHLVSHWAAQTGLRSLALAGGVALNCVAVGKLAGSGLVDAVYVQPSAGDEGTAIGAALSAADPRRAAAALPAMTYLGPEVGSAGPGAGHQFESWALAPGIAEVAVAELLADGCIVGWAQGRLEFGPRALGNRSILADPRRAETRDRVNAAVKFREGFRPLAPAVKAERTNDYFEVPAGVNMRHMTVAVPARPSRRADIPAVIHGDGTSRIQAVHAAEAPRLWRILDHFEQLTGIPMVVNTSLNVKGQPTARDGSEAFRTFTSSALDVVIIGDRLYTKPQWAGPVRAAVEAAQRRPVKATSR